MSIDILPSMLENDKTLAAKKITLSLSLSPFVLLFFSGGEYRYFTICT